MIKKNLIGEKNDFAIEYSFFDNTHETEIAMYVKDNNILSFERNGEHLTTRWNIDNLAMWLRKFIDEMKNDPYPVECDGEFSECHPANLVLSESEKWSHLYRL